ncbi:MAG: isoamylase early set domain-containing protein [Myxococcales bacterium]|nr:isoamylase early set domain-containing protein [Myxococcales bacterium]
MRRHTTIHIAAIVAAAALVCLPGAALAAPLELSTEASLGAGYDSNVYLPAAALPTDVAGRGGSFIALRPFLVGALSSSAGHRLSLGYALEARQFIGADIDSETTIEQRAVLGYASAPLFGFRLELELILSHLYFRQLAGGGWLGVGGELSLSRVLGSAVVVEVGYAPTYHDYHSASSAQQDVSHRLFAELRWTPLAGLVVEPHYAFTVVDANPDELDSTRHMVGFALRYRPARLPLTFIAGYDLGVLALQSAVTRTNPQGKPLPSKPTERTDLLHQPFAEVRWQAKRWLAVAASYRALVGHSDVEESYSRHVVLASACFTFDLGAGGSADAGPREARRGHIASAGNVTFSASQTKASSVSVVGSFNDWDPERGRMARQGDGRWQLALELPPGNHRYMLWVDGRVVAPTRCERWVADGFGAKNCVLSVGKSASREAAR